MIEEDPMQNLSPESWLILQEMLKQRSKPNTFQYFTKEKVLNKDWTFIIEIEEKEVK